MRIAKRQSISLKIIDNLQNYPVFLVLGSNRRSRRAFIGGLMVELERRLLYCIYLQDKDRPNVYAASVLIKDYDLVLIDRTSWLFDQVVYEGGPEPQGLVWSGGDGQAMQRFVELLIKKLDDLVSQLPVWGCILIGGKSSRMGRAKHLIEHRDKKTWLERTVDIVRPLVDGLVVSGAGLLPAKLSSTVRLPDIPGVVGPLSGIIAASRWQPMVTWLILACDMPQLSTESVQWLLADRRAGCWGRVPRLTARGHCEPLFAWYDIRATRLFEEQLQGGDLRAGSSALHQKIETPTVPASLHCAWDNVNTPREHYAYRFR